MRQEEVAQGGRAIHHHLKLQTGRGAGLVGGIGGCRHHIGGVTDLSP